MTSSGIDRRGLLAGAAGLIGAGVLTGGMAGCGGKKSGPSAANPTGRAVRWRRALPHGGDDNGSPLAVTLAGGVLYAAQSGSVSALDPSSGTKRWTSEHGPVAVDLSLGGVQSRNWAPVAGGGLVYTVHHEQDQPATLFALDAATGKQRWSYPGSSGGITPPALSAGAVCVAAADGVTLLDAATGGKRWTAPLPAGAGGTPAFANGVICLVDAGGTPTALDAATGKVRWARADARNTQYANRAVTIAGGTAYVGANLAFDLATGRQLWSSVSGVDAGRLPVTVAGGTLYLAGGGDPGEAPAVAALDPATGALRWNAPVAGDHIQLFGPPAVLGSTAYVGTRSSGLLAFDAASGRRRWSLDVGKTPLSAPVAAGGKVYAVVRSDGRDDNYDQDLGGFADYVYALSA